MVSTLASLQTAHTDMIHDAQLDFYGKRLATCSSDRTIKIFEVNGDQHRLIRELTGHDGPVWQIAWAHPSFGNLLASGSYDKRVLIWKETPTGWEIVKDYQGHESSINAVAWAPAEVGFPLLAVGSSDGDISLLACIDGKWETQKLPKAHPTGVAAVSWAPVDLDHTHAHTQDGSPIARFVSGGCDNKAKVWTLAGKAPWTAVHPEELAGHANWVRDVAWAPLVGAEALIATCSQDGAVLLWRQDRSKSSRWESRPLNTFAVAVWRLSWSATGTVLAVSSADNKVSLWKESLTGEWSCVSELEDDKA